MGSVEVVGSVLVVTVVSSSSNLPAVISSSSNLPPVVPLPPVFKLGSFCPDLLLGGARLLHLV